MFDLLVCLSLFNLVLLRIWAQLLPAVVNPANLYYMEEAPHRIHYPLVLLSLVAGLSNDEPRDSKALRYALSSYFVRVCQQR